VAQTTNDPDVIADQAGALFLRAGIEAQFGYFNDAIEHYLRAIELGNELTAKYPNDARYLDILAMRYKDLAVAYSQVQFSSEQIRDVNSKALALHRRLVAEHGDVTEYHRNLARLLHNMAGTGTGTERRSDTGSPRRI